MGNILAKDGICLHYDEFGTGDRVILSAQIGFCPYGMHQALAGIGYHVYCMTLRGFSPSDYVTEDYGDAWYDVFADDVAGLADHLGIRQFFISVLPTARAWAGIWSSGTRKEYRPLWL